MRKNFLRSCSVLLALMLLCGVFSGCGSGNEKVAADKPAAGTATTEASNADSKSNDSKNSNAAAPDTSKKVEVVMYLAGDAPPDMPLVNDELNKKLEKDLNCTAKIIGIPWADFDTKYKMIVTSGEQYDAIYASNWTYFRTYASQGTFLALDDLLPEYAPNIFKLIDEQGWKEATVNNKIYGIPAKQEDYLANCWIIRGDLREKYGIPPVTDFATMETYLDAVKKNEKDMIPWDAGERDPHQWLESTQYDELPGTDIYITSYDNINDVKNSTFMPEKLEYFKMMKRWNDKGFWSKSVLSNKEFSRVSLKNGKSAAASCNSGQARTTISEVNLTHPEYKPEFICFRDKVKAGIHPMAAMADGMAIGKNANEPERALMVMDKIRSDRTYYDLIFYGIKGKHYVLNDKGNFMLPSGLTQDKNGYKEGNAGQWGLTVQDFRRYDANDWMPYYDVVKPDWKTFATPDKLTNFTFQKDNVKSEWAAITQINTQYESPLFWGKVDPEKGLKTLQDKLKQAGIDKVDAEVKKQVEQYAKDFNIK